MKDHDNSDVMTAGSTINRNDPCPCGSGKKYKKCCMGAAGLAAVKSPMAPGAVAPADVDTLLRQGNALHRGGNLDAAVGMYRQVLAREPRHAAALYYLGQVMGQLGNLDQGIRLLRQSISIDGSRARSHGNLAGMLLDNGDADGSLASARRAVELDPDDSLARCTAASCLSRLNRVDEAAVEAERAAALRPDDPQCQVLLGTVARQQGEFARAREIFERLLDSTTLDATIRRAALHQLGLVLDRLGEYADAFARFEACGAATARTPEARRHDPVFWSRRIAAYRKSVTPELLERWRGVGYDDDHPVPVFMIGFPRSGTTMTEQILAAHPAVATSDERPFTKAIDDAMREMFDDAEEVAALVDRLDEDRIKVLRRAYWRAVRAVNASDLTDRVFVDKLPLNIIEIGLLNIVFPEARVIVALRDPRDVCLSCLIQDFTLNAAMVNFVSFERTVRFYREVMTQWLEVRDSLTVPVLEAKYEDTVRDLPTHARRLLDFLGLDWNDRVLRFHEIARERLISTPSFEAVTQPIHTRAVGRWKNYEAQIGGHTAALREFLEAFGYA